MEVLNNWDITDSLAGMVFDTTAATLATKLLPVLNCKILLGRGYFGQHAGTTLGKLY